MTKFNISKKIFFFLTLFTALTSEAAFGKKVSSNSQRYRLIWIEDPSTKVTIMWESLSSNAGLRKVHYGESDGGQNIARYSYSVIAENPYSYKGMSHVVARISKLKPNKNYYFVIEDSGKLSPRFWFRTAPDTRTEPLSIIAGGDSRNNREPRQNANILVSKLRPLAVFFGGDYTASGSNKEWQEWFDDWQLTISKDGRMYPIVPARGNHENSNEILKRLFDAPDTNYFSTGFGGDLLKLYTLNTESSIAGNQTTWLKADLNASSHFLWTFAQYHRPMSPHNQGKKEGTDQYRAWAQLFFEKGMDLVIDSDSHLMKSTWPIRPSSSSGSDEGFRREDDAGTVYVGEGGWGAPLRPADDPKSWTRDADSINHFHWIFVHQGKVEIRVIETSNASEVRAVSDSAPFKIPSKLNVWKGKNGAVIELKRPTLN